jgi:hypothetical protein
VATWEVTWARPMPPDETSLALDTASTGSLVIGPFEIAN